MEQSRAHIAIAEAIDGELARADGVEQFGLVRGIGVQRPASAAVAPGRLAKPAGQLTQRCGVLHRSQGAQVAVVGGLRGLRPPMQVGDPLAHGIPGFVRLGLALRGAERLEVRRVIDRGLNPQHAALLVVHLDRVLPQPVLDPHALGAGLHVADHFGLQPCRDIAGGWDVAAQEAHYVPAEERRQAVVDQPRIQPCQRPAVTEQDVGGPFALVGRPVVRSGKPGTSSRAAGSGCGQ